MTAERLARKPRRSLSRAKAI
uniref:Uncharacterized protein n=1 Tax=Anguilla anguilla TaxID=7936 RepID=A0A0E9TLP7_ANGAN